MGGAWRRGSRIPDFKDGCAAPTSRYITATPSGVDRKRINGGHYVQSGSEEEEKKVNKILFLKRGSQKNGVTLF